MILGLNRSDCSGVSLFRNMYCKVSSRKRKFFPGSSDMQTGRVQQLKPLWLLCLTLTSREHPGLFTKALFPGCRAWMCVRVCVCRTWASSVWRGWRSSTWTFHIYFGVSMSFIYSLSHTQIPHSLKRIYEGIQAISAAISPAEHKHNTTATNLPWHLSHLAKVLTHSDSTISAENQYPIL